MFRSLQAAKLGGKAIAFKSLMLLAASSGPGDGMKIVQPLAGCNNGSTAACVMR